MDELTKALEDKGVRVVTDTRSNYTPGWKYNHWELKGLPLRVELGPKDMDNAAVMTCRRDTGKGGGAGVGGKGEGGCWWGQREKQQRCRWEGEGAGREQGTQQSGGGVAAACFGRQLRSRMSNDCFPHSPATPPRLHLNPRAHHHNLLRRQGGGAVGGRGHAHPGAAGDHPGRHVRRRQVAHRQLHRDLPQLGGVHGGAGQQAHGAHALVRARHTRKRGCRVGTAAMQ